MDTTVDAAIGNIRVTQDSKNGRWLVTWDDTTGNVREFEYFEQASRCVEGELLAN